MIFVQVAFIVISIFMLLVVFLQFKNNTLSLSQIVIWSIAWIILLLSSIFVSEISKLVKFTGIQRPVDFFVYISIVVLFIFVYKLNLKLEVMNRQITKLVRSKSLSKDLPQHLLKEKKSRK